MRGDVRGDWRGYREGHGIQARLEWKPVGSWLEAASACNTVCRAPVAGKHLVDALRPHLANMAVSHRPKLGEGGDAERTRTKPPTNAKI